MLQWSVACTSISSSAIVTYFWWTLAQKLSFFCPAPVTGSSEMFTQALQMHASSSSVKTLLLGITSFFTATAGTSVATCSSTTAFFAAFTALLEALLLVFAFPLFAVGRGGLPLDLPASEAAFFWPTAAFFLVDVLVLVMVGSCFLCQWVATYLVTRSVIDDREWVVKNSVVTR